MKKIKIIAVICLIVITAALYLTYLIRIEKRDFFDIREENLAEKALISVSSNKAAKAFLTDNFKNTYWKAAGREAQEIILSFENETEFNTLCVAERDLNVSDFAVDVLGADGEWEQVYRQNEIGEARICAVGERKARALRLRIISAKGAAKLSDIAVYKVLPVDFQGGFRVTAYLRYEAISKKSVGEVLHSEHFNTVTDLILFSPISFNEEGELVNKAEDLDVKVGEIRELINESGKSGRRLISGIFNPRGNNAACVKAMRENRDKLINNIIEYLTEYGFDGVDFNWEFPSNKYEYSVYGEFMAKLKESLREYGIILSVAIAPWGVSFPKEAIDAIDVVQMMSYDLYDQNGDNNSFRTAVRQPVDYLLNMGFSKEKINNGISFYGRPADASYKWIDYNNADYTHNGWSNENNGVYFNSVTGVRDRVAAAALQRIGGVMVFALDEDYPVSDSLSLTRAIGGAVSVYAA